MPTWKEVEEYKKRMERILMAIENSTLSDEWKEKLMNEYLERWKTAQETLLGLGVPLEDEGDEETK